MSDSERKSARGVTMKLFRLLRGLYEPLLVLLVVGAAGLLLYALYHALGGGRGDSICFEAAFDDVSGIKERSNVLFKGMPVGSVGVMKYDPATDKILVRIDIKNARDIPANIKPYVESSLMGQSSIALRTETTDPAPQLLAAVVSQHQAKNRESLYRLDGVRPSRADSLMPGLDARAQKTMAAASDAMVAASDAMAEIKELAGNWRELSAAILDSKDKTVSELEKVTVTLDKAGQAVTRSELQLKNLGIASEKLGEASDSVKMFMDVIKVKPNALVWGMNEQQRAMLDQQRARHSKRTGAGKQ
jgi:ABC-type transporter Mla subunit MlaD